MTCLALLLYEMKIALFGHENAVDCILNVLSLQVPVSGSICNEQNNTFPCSFSDRFMVIYCSGTSILIEGGAACEEWSRKLVFCAFRN